MKFDINNIFYLSFGLIIYLRKAINWILKGRKVGNLVKTGYTIIPEKQRKNNWSNSISEILYGITLVASGIISRNIFLIISGIFPIINSVVYITQKEKKHEVGYLYKHGVKILEKYYLWSDLKINRLSDEIVEFSYKNKDYHLYLDEKIDMKEIE